MATISSTCRVGTGTASAVWKQWGVKSLPTMILVKDGQITKQWNGKVDIKDVERSVRDALMR